MSIDDFDAEAELSRLLENFAENYDSEPEYAAVFSKEDEDICQDQDYIAYQKALALNTAALQRAGDALGKVPSYLENFETLRLEEEGGADARLNQADHQEGSPSIGPRWTLPALNPFKFADSLEPVAANANATASAEWCTQQPGHSGTTEGAPENIIDGATEALSSEPADKHAALQLGIPSSSKIAMPEPQEGKGRHSSGSAAMPPKHAQDQRTATALPRSGSRSLAESRRRSQTTSCRPTAKSQRQHATQQQMSPGRCHLPISSSSCCTNPIELQPGITPTGDAATAAVITLQLEQEMLADEVAASRALCAELERQRAQHVSREAAEAAERRRRQAEAQEALFQFAREHIAAGALVPLSICTINPWLYPGHVNP